MLRLECELDLRSLKQTMQMDVLRCKTPELVRKGDLDAHPGLQSHSCGHGTGCSTTHDLEPRSISFKGAIQSLELFNHDRVER